MGHVLLKQPDGKLALWSTSVDNFILIDSSPAEVIDFYIDRGVDKALRDTQETLSEVQHPDYKPYVSWDSALETLKSEHGKTIDDLRKEVAPIFSAEKWPVLEQRLRERGGYMPGEPLVGIDTELVVAATTDLRAILACNLTHISRLYASISDLEKANRQLLEERDALQGRLVVLEERYVQTEAKLLDATRELGREEVVVTVRNLRRPNPQDDADKTPVVLPHVELCRGKQP